MTNRRIAVLILFSLCVACSESSVENLGSQFVKSGTFGPNGGTLTVTAADDAALAGTQIVISPSALHALTTIQIGVTNQQVVDAAKARGPVIDFEPTGTQFAIPATVSIPVTPGSTDPSHIGVMAVEPDGGAHDIAPGTVTVAKGGADSLATFQVSGFTHFGAHVEEVCNPDCAADATCGSDDGCGGVCNQNCVGSTTGSSTTSGAESSTGGSSTGGIGGAATTGGSTTGGSTTGGSTTGGAGTGGRTPFDGGYVLCTASADGGDVAWICQPGTYFCESPGNCAQCLADSDCANAALPTYDVQRQRCDLDSGLPGYQNFCQECLGDTDCTASTGQCDLSTSADQLQASILSVGFETCGEDAGTIPCTPESCAAPDSCDLDSGACIGPLGLPSPCQTDFDCSPSIQLCDHVTGRCVDCFSNSDCVLSGNAALGGSYCNNNTCTYNNCGVDDDCVGNRFGPHCVDDPKFGHYCGCGSDDDCSNSPDGPHCVTDAGAVEQGSCFCDTSSECPIGKACRVDDFGAPTICLDCALDTDCPDGLFCGQDAVCRPRCDDAGTGCDSDFPVCDVNRITYSTPKSFCYECLTGDDCAAGKDCTVYSCGSGCTQDSNCHSGQVCAGGACHPSCDAGACPGGQACDAEGAVGNGNNVCYECRSALDCPAGQGCGTATHTCGACDGPSAPFIRDQGEQGGLGGPFECAPDAICSNYWVAQNYKAGWVPGVCLQNCDNVACLDPGDTCEVLRGITPDHKYCFGCVQDSDCGDAGGWCDTSFTRTFSCQPGPRP